MRLIIVEVAGVEPASKQGTRKLSTRLAATWSFYPGPAGGRLTEVPVPEFRTPAGTVRRTLSKSMIPRMESG